MNNYNPELYGFEWADEDGPDSSLRPWDTADTLKQGRKTDSCKKKENKSEG